MLQQIFYLSVQATDLGQIGWEFVAAIKYPYFLSNCRKYKFDIDLTFKCEGGVRG